VGAESLFFLVGQSSPRRASLRRMREVKGGGRIGLEFEGMARLGRIRHVFSTRDREGGGNLALSRGDLESALAERAFWSDWIGVSERAWVVGGAAHGNQIAVVAQGDCGLGATEPDTAIPGTDGLLTTQADVPLFLPVADCAAVLLYAGGESPGLGLVHAGWRGLASNVLAAAVDELCRLTNCSPQEIFAGISPCIGPANFEVGDDVRSAAPENRQILMGSAWHVDLAGWAFEQLSCSGLSPELIECSGLDTVEREDLFFSHRRDGEAAGRNGLLAVLA